METERGAEGWRRLVLMAPPPGSFGLQTPELFLPGSLSLGQKSSEVCAPPLPCSLWVLRTSLSLIRNLVRAHQGCFCLPTPKIFGTVTGDPLYKRVCTIQPSSDPARMDGFGQASWALISRAELSQGGSFLGLAWQGHCWTL